ARKKAGNRAWGRGKEGGEGRSRNRAPQVSSFVGTDDDNRVRWAEAGAGAGDGGAAVSGVSSRKDEQVSSTGQASAQPAPDAKDSRPAEV
ncbi:unnamed protein product, partial [Discosporangium mesarthrocarpum]